ncbi:MAG: HEPN domain-containing protein [Candidatus Aenigmarchaeota archaeon]|nr:HEPN domain-containing protein [Candidatus Aenigmarchaeota archaeon]
MKTIDKLPGNLPKGEKRIEKTFQDCMKEERKLIRTRTFVKTSKKFYRTYVNSAKKALNTAKILLDNEAYEWSIVPAYSAIYQSANAIIVKELGKECRDHFCLLITLLKLKKIGFDELKNIESLRSRLDLLKEEELAFANKIRLVRSTVIYRPSEKFDEKKIAEYVFKKAQNFVNKVIEVLE